MQGHIRRAAPALCYLCPADQLPDGAARHRAPAPHPDPATFRSANRSPGCRADRNLEQECGARTGGPLACVPRSRSSLRSHARATERTMHGDLARRSSLDFSLGNCRHRGRYCDQVRKLGAAIVTTAGPERCRIAQRFRRRATHENSLN